MTDQRRGASANGGSPSPGALARRACGELAELIGRQPEGIVSLERTDDGWRVGVEVLETRRIPDTADVLAEYEVETDDRGGLVGYRRTRRYTRGQLQDDR
jgi:Gas vesicle synthesis protein GvpO